MDRLSIQDLSVIEGKIESKISEVREICKKDALNTIDEKFRKIEKSIEDRAQENTLLFNELNKKYKQCDEEIKKVKEKILDEEKQLDTLNKFRVSATNDLEKLHHQKLEQNDFNVEIARKVLNLDNHVIEFYGKLESLVERFGRSIEDKIDKKIDGRFENIEKKIDKRFEDIEKKIDKRFEDFEKKIDENFQEMDKRITRATDSLELRFFVFKSEIEKNFENIISILNKRGKKSDSVSEIVLIHDRNGFI